MASATPAIRTPAPSSDGAEDDVGLGVDPRPPDGDRLAAFAPTPPSPKGPESFHAAGLAADLRDSPPVGFELTHRAPLADEPATPQPDRTAELTAIEVVAAMFQSLLPDERVPAVLRILFARLQLPVIRVAVAEPWRFAQADHPARRLIDRLGSCALDLRAGDTAAEESLAIELRRIVEVVEAYPDAGRRAFEVVLQEFDRFQAGNLAAGHATADHGLPLTQRVAQRETMVVQCTIELRRMVDGVPVHDGVHRFLFQTWAHVLAAVRAADTGRGDWRSRTRIETRGRRVDLGGGGETLTPGARARSAPTAATAQRAARWHESGRTGQEPAGCRPRGLEPRVGCWARRGRRSARARLADDTDSPAGVDGGGLGPVWRTGTGRCAGSSDRR